MYSKHQELDKFRFHQHFPYHSTCNPATLKISGSMMPQTQSTVTSARSRSVVIPLSPLSTYQDEEDPVSEKKSSPISSSSSSWWSWTFGIVTAPLIFWGCPFYLLTMTPPQAYQPQIRTTRVWLKRVLDCSSSPLTMVLTVTLMILTIITNIYLIYLFCNLLNNLFIRGVYETSMIKDIVDFVRDIPVIIVVNYVWLNGYKINGVISQLNQKYRKYQRHVSCTIFRVRVLVMIGVIVCLHTVRYFSFEKYSTFGDAVDVSYKIDKAWEFSTDVFLSLLLPFYCAFCFAVKFELLIIKSVIYEMVSKRVTPSVAHLSKFKTLYTHAADHIDVINGFFSTYLSLSIGMMIIGTLVDADNLLEMVAEVVFKGFFGSLFPKEGRDKFKKMLNITGEEGPPSPFLSPIPPENLPVNPIEDGENATEIPISLSPGTVRRLNADIACLLTVYCLIFYTVWQAVVTNDAVRELHVWLNDFVSGAGGTNVEGILIDLGSNEEEDNDDIKKTATILMNNDSFRKGAQDVYGGGQQLPLLWGANKELDGESDQFLEKFKMLKAYIHVRLQLEKSSMLSIALVGLFVPTLSGRLKRYNVLF